MYNWNTDTTQLKKNPEKYTVWKLEQLINYGLNGEKIDRKDLLKYWDKLKIESQYKKFLQFLLWQSKLS